MLFAGCVSPGSMIGAKPNLKFGVLSDIHITDWASTDVFRKTLGYFRSQDVDAVMIAGDLADHGILPQLECVAKAWYEVFPDDRGLDGRHVEKLFVITIQRVSVIVIRRWTGLSSRWGLRTKTLRS